MVRKDPNWERQMVSELDKCRTVRLKEAEIYVNTGTKYSDLLEDKEFQIAPWIAPWARGTLTKLRP